MMRGGEAALPHPEMPGPQAPRRRTMLRLAAQRKAAAELGRRFQGNGKSRRLLQATLQRVMRLRTTLESSGPRGHRSTATAVLEKERAKAEVEERALAATASGRRRTALGGRIMQRRKRQTRTTGGDETTSHVMGPPRRTRTTSATRARRADGDGDATRATVTERALGGGDRAAEVAMQQPRRNQERLAARRTRLSVGRAAAEVEDLADRGPRRQAGRRLVILEPMVAQQKAAQQFQPPTMLRGDEKAEMVVAPSWEL
mmetsp:Transcript_35032/g.96878  ORF Transcript_35032/g.96878 Transcript_35032/m.96878 type:complete len:258 (-) Transcript_35032:109-882(-)